MIEKYKPAVAIAVFYAIAVSLRYLTNETSILSGVENVFFRTVAQGIGPAVGAWIACVLFGIKMEMSLRGNFRNMLLPLAIYWLFPILLIEAVAYFTGKAISPLPVFIILVYGLCEEIGWRGFLQQQLRPLPRVFGIVMVAALWFVWHLDFELSIRNLLFFGILLLGSWGIGLVADKTRSLLAVAAFHSINNLFGTWGTQEVLIQVALLGVWIASIIIFRGSRKASPETGR